MIWLWVLLLITGVIITYIFIRNIPAAWLADILLFRVDSKVSVIVWVGLILIIVSFIKLII